MNRSLGRPAFLSGAAAAVLAPRALAAQPAPPIRIAGTPQMDFCGSLYAQASGAFQKNALQTQVSAMNSGAAIIAAILGGSIEFGSISMLNLVEAHARGIPLVIECPASIYSSAVHDAIGLVVAANSPIRTGRDLAGKTFAVPALGDTFTITGSNWIDKNGGDSTTVKFLELPGNAVADALAGGRVDAAILVQPTLKNAVASGKCRVLADPFAAIAPRFVSTAYVCSVDFAAKNPAAVARFRKVISDANTYVDAHVPEVLPLMSKFTGVDLAVLSNLPFTRLGTTADLKDAHTTIQPLIDVALKYKAISHAYDANDLIDPVALN